MKKKKPNLPGNPAYLANIAQAGNTPPETWWYSPVLNRIRTLNLKDIAFLLIAALILVVLIWQPPFQLSTLRNIVAYLFLGALVIVSLLGLVNLFMKQFDPEIVSLQSVQDVIMEDAAPHLRWIESNGGPLLLASKELLPFWEGADPPGNGRTVEATFRWQGIGAPATDYDRACDIDSFIGQIPVGPGKALVLGDEPLPTAWWPAQRTQGGGLLVRQVYKNSDENIVDAIKHMPDDIWTETGITLTVGSEPLYLFDSAYTGSDMKKHLELVLTAGQYSISTCEYEPDRNTSLVLHCLFPTNK